MFHQKFSGKENFRGLFLTLCVFVLLLLCSISCRTVKLQSQWIDEELVIDGSSSDWLGSMVIVEEQNVSVGIRNDSDFLYICLTGGDRFLNMQALSRGLTIWFDPTGGKNKVVGIRYPKGFKMPEPGTLPQDPVERPSPEKFREMGREMMKDSLASLEILYNEGESSETIKKEDLKGLEVEVDISGEFFTYELKIPLEKSEENPYGLGLRADLKKLGIGLVIPKFEFSFRGPGMGGFPGGKPGGGMGGRPGGGGMMGRPGGFGGMGPGGFSGMNGLKIWASVSLASSSVAESE